MVGRNLVATAVGVLASSCGSLAFVAPLQARGSLVDVGQSWTCRVPAAAGSASSRLGRKSTRCRMEAEELDQIVEYISAKRLEVVDEAQGIFKYEFTVEAPGSMTNRLNHRITRAVREKADFPGGYKKGEIPPYVMPEVNKFVVEEIMNDGIVMALETYGLVGAEGEGTNADLLTDIKDMLAVFKPGKPLSFSCMIDAKAKPEEEVDDAAVEDATLSGSSDA